MKYLLPAALPALLTALPMALHATPVFLPARDVAVTYTVSETNRAPANYQLYYDAANQIARIDGPAGYYGLGNLPAGQAELVVPALHAVVQAPDFSALPAEIYNADGASFTPLGAGHFAGLDCEKYLLLDKNGTGTVCLTTNGVVLHFTGHDAHGAAEATALTVTYAPQSPDLFAVPQGFTPLNLPPGALAALLSQ
jgi:hypothetical protein